MNVFHKVTLKSLAEKPYPYPGNHYWNYSLSFHVHRRNHNGFLSQPIPD